VDKIAVDGAIIQAMVDCAIEEEDGLESIDNLEVLKVVFRKMARSMGTRSSLRRIPTSAHPDALAGIMLMEYISTEEELDLLAEILFEYDELFSAAALEPFVDAYRARDLRAHLRYGNYRHAWEDLDKAYFGLSDGAPEEGALPSAGMVFEMAASASTVRALIEEIHQHMCGRGLVAPITEDFIEKPASDTHFPRGEREVPGWKFAVAMGASQASGVNRTGQMILAIKRRLCDERNATRSARALRRKAAKK